MLALIERPLLRAASSDLVFPIEQRAIAPALIEEAAQSIAAITTLVASTGSHLSISSKTIRRARHSLAGQ